MNRYQETRFSRFWVSEGILYFVYKPIVYLDYTTAKTIVRERLLFQRETAYPILCDTSGIADSEKSARDYLANDGSALAKAVAIVDYRKVSKILLRFYLMKNKPSTPTKIFRTKAQAIEFLTPYV